MGQALIVCAIQTICELVSLMAECVAIRPKIPQHTIRATVDESFWRGVINEMFADGHYSTTRLKVVDLYTKSTCDYLGKKGHQEIAGCVRAAHEQWRDEIKDKIQ